MKFLWVVALCACAQAQTFGVYSGASYQPVVAPNSWAVAFGTAMATQTATGTLTAAGEWPTALGGITLTVDGQPAQMDYVSPHQINFLVPDVTDFGAINVVITNSGTGATQTSTVNLQNTAAAIFTSNASGSGAGSILNGVTGAGAPFLVVTPQNGGSDLRTRLAIYCTGLRYTGNPTEDPTVTNVAQYVSAQGTDTSGNLYTFTVEYAGASDPAFPGLDQVNIVLPAQLDGAGIVSLSVTADTTSNTVTFQMGSIPVSELALAGLALSTSETTGGTSVTGTVSLTGTARTGGYPVTLRSSDPTVSVPSQLTVAQGQASATFTIATGIASTTQSATISATGGGGTFTAPLQVDSSNIPQLDSFTVSPASVEGGGTFSGTVGVAGAAPVGGVNVQVTSSDSSVQPPATVTVRANNDTANFTIPTTSVTSVRTVTLTATLGSASLTQQVTVAPPVQLTLSSNSVAGGASLTGTVTLGNDAPAEGVNIAISSSATAFATTPGVVNIPAGQFSASFTITSFAVTSAHTVTITATDGNIGSATATLTVNPQTPGALQSLAISPTEVEPGSSAGGTITLSSAAGFGGLVVSLKSSNASVAVPLTVTVPQGSSSATFTIATSVAAPAQTVTITATAGSVSQTATLTVE